jgi:hypothetical protein
MEGFINRILEQMPRVGKPQKKLAQYGFQGVMQVTNATGKVTKLYPAV